MKQEVLNAQILRSLLDYDPATGLFTWKVDRFFGRNLKRISFKAGDPAGCVNKALGSVVIGIGGKPYYAHRLAWLHVHGEWPPVAIDHINRDPSDNRLANLRLANKSQNSANRPAPITNKSGFRGVSRLRNKWLAQIVIDGKQTHLGLFVNKEDASAAYDKAAIEHFGDYYHSSSPHFQRRAAEV